MDHRLQRLGNSIDQLNQSFNGFRNITNQSLNQLAETLNQTHENIEERDNLITEDREYIDYLMKRMTLIHNCFYEISQWASFVGAALIDINRHFNGILGQRVADLGVDQQIVNWMLENPKPSRDNNEIYYDPRDYNRYGQRDAQLNLPQEYPYGRDMYLYDLEPMGYHNEMDEDIDFDHNIQPERYQRPR